MTRVGRWGGRPFSADGLAVAIGCVALALSMTARAAATWTSDDARSQLVFTATQGGGEFDGRFHRFHAEISFDPADLAASRFEVGIETGSADTQEPNRDAALIGPDFFASDRWPRARYEASEFVDGGNRRFVAHGRLTLRGVTRDVPVTFSFKPDASGRTAQLQGEATVRRLDYGVGQGEWQDTQWVGNDVRIRFDLLLHRK